MKPRSIADLDAAVASCRACPRLVTWREQIARDKRAAVDRQAIGQNHDSGEIGRIEVTKLESKGKQNRRVYLVLAEEQG